MSEDQDAILSPDAIHALFTDSQPLTRHPAVIYLAGLSESSRRTMFQSLSMIAQLLTGGQLDVFSLNWSALRYEHTLDVRRRLSELYKPATVNKMLSALRQVLFHAWELGLMPTEDYEQARSVTNVRGRVVAAGRRLDAGELEALFAVCEADHTAAGARDAAILALMYVAGLRRVAVVQLDMSHLDLARGVLHVPSSGKNGFHVAYVSTGGARRAVCAWLAERGHESGPLFWPVSKNGQLTKRRLSTQAINHILVKRGREAGLPHFSPHDLRWTLVADLLDAGVSMDAIRLFLGSVGADHADSAASIVRIIDRLRVPYHPLSLP